MPRVQLTPMAIRIVGAIADTAARAGTGHSGRSAWQREDVG
jgi:hypothetical protein